MIKCAELLIADIGSSTVIEDHCFGYRGDDAAGVNCITKWDDSIVEDPLGDAGISYTAKTEAEARDLLATAAYNPGAPE